jgi:hypothetical protein
MKILAAGVGLDDVRDVLLEQWTAVSRQSTVLGAFEVALSCEAEGQPRA